jgi:hypothetical protein
MAHNPILFSTTGVQDPVEFPDLGSRQYAHPTVDYDLSEEFAGDRILDSDSFAAALTNGWITVKANDGSTITDPDDLWQVGEETVFMFSAPGREVSPSAGAGWTVQATTIWNQADMQNLQKYVWKGWITAPSGGPVLQTLNIRIVNGANGDILGTLTVTEGEPDAMREIDFTSSPLLPAIDSHLELQTNASAANSIIHSGAFIFRG